MDLDAVNGLDLDGFVAGLGAVFEHSPWIAAAAWPARPFADVTAVHEAMVAVVRDAGSAQQLALLRAHPELAGQEAAAGHLAPASREEQAGAGLRDLTTPQATRMRELNAAYRARFGFPFIIAVRHHSKAGILAEFERRVANPIDVERAAALEEVFKIARLRLDALLTRATNRPRSTDMGFLTTHVLDTAHGCPARGVRIELLALDGTAGGRHLGTFTTDADGRTGGALLGGEGFAVGRYELLFHVGDYFAARGLALPSPGFLDVIPIRFGIAEEAAHYHVPLLVSPWSYSTYRGS